MCYQLQWLRLYTVEYYWIKTVVILLIGSQMTKSGDEMHEKEHGDNHCGKDIILGKIILIPQWFAN